MEDLLPDFLAEALESLELLDTEVVKLERQPGDKPTLGSIFRHVHTIKGTCGFLGLARLEKVAHAAENVLGRHRDGVLPVTPGSITLILCALDAIRSIVNSLQTTGQEPTGHDADLIAELADAAEGRAATAAVHVAEVVAEAIQVPVATSTVSLLATSAPATRVPEPATQTIRVNVDVLEGLMTLVSELVLTRNQILQLARSEHAEVFTGPLQRLSHITSELQEGVMKTRMQPIGNAWGNLPRLVRDLAHELGKKIELVMHGAETELDRQVLELIKDPLTHMVRNSGDHGLEGPADRRAAGKSEQGRIRLDAYHEGGHILIEVGDDGRGLPVERIRAKVVGNGLATEAELAAMTDQQIQSFIFRPGFSTAATVTSVSGRGVGMDVVKTNIERIGGTIELSSTEGVGTTFKIKIPLTLAIVSALIVEVCNQRFAIPQISVIELVSAQAPRAHASEDALGGSTLQESARDGSTSHPVIERIDDTPVLRLRDHLLPLIDLGSLLKLGKPGPADAPVGQLGNRLSGGNLFVVVTQVGTSRFGLIVDRIFDTEEIVLKPVAPILRHITLFSGATILGDGQVIMILDPNGIARSSGLGTGGSGGADRAVAGPAAEATSSRKIALLLFKAGGGQCKAVPLDLVARLETLDRSAIERSGSELVTQYRGRLMPLVPLVLPAGGELPDRQSTLVFADGERVMGLMVDEIIDVVEDHLRVELSTDQPGFLGTAIVDGHAADILDTGYWLQRAFKDWFARATPSGQVQKSLLVVEDSPFFRSLIIPALAAAGFHVTAVDNPLAALALREAGKTFDLILSDIEMPEMDGLSFVREIRKQGAWASLPVIALSSLSTDAAVQRGREAGFDAYISKFDKAILLEAVQLGIASGRAGAGSKLMVIAGAGT